jgi:hypothetical protein
MLLERQVRNLCSSFAATGFGIKILIDFSTNIITLLIFVAKVSMMLQLEVFGPIYLDRKGSKRSFGGIPRFRFATRCHLKEVGWTDSGTP